MKLSASQQQNAVSEGMALGLLMCGRDSVPNDKVRVDLAFCGAWRSWSHCSTFPTVDAAIHKFLNGRMVMTHATERKHVSNLYWDASGRDLVVNRRAQWEGDVLDRDDHDDIAQSLDAAVPADGWRALATDFLQRMGP